MNKVSLFYIHYKEFLKFLFEYKIDFFFNFDRFVALKVIYRCKKIEISIAFLLIFLFFV
jgi:hypothetical protein